MSRTRNTLDALRTAGRWLMVVAVLGGPLGIGTSPAAAAVKTCGLSCQCDDTRHREEAGERASAVDEREAGANIACSDEHPCGPACPDGCTDCDCCPALMIGLVSMTAPALPGSASSSKLLTPTDAPPCGDISDIFRPPRRLP